MPGEPIWEEYMDIILSTRNAGKTAQIQAMFADTGIILRTLADAGIAGEAIEDGKTFRDNAFKKALYAHEQARVPSWTMADDTGICITALGGAPGVNTRYWAGPDASDEELQAYALRRMRGIKERSACFQTVVAVLDPERRPYTFYGSLFGTLLDEPRPIIEKGLPFSPIFVPQGLSLALGDMPIEEQNLISHRGKAFRNARLFFESLPQAA